MRLLEHLREHSMWIYRKVISPAIDAIVTAAGFMFMAFALMAALLPSRDRRKD